MWMNYICFCIILCICIIEVDAAPKKRSHKNATYRRKKERRKEENCWMTLNATEHFVIIEALEEKYAKVRKEYDELQLLEGFDEEILGNLLENQGAANREAQKVGNKKTLIPSGINLGGHSIMRTPDSLMFFHRMKLRNDTRFRVNFLSSNFSTMTMVMQLSLNDLHLVGNYERMDTMLLRYTPSYGEIEILLRDIFYKMEGRYRMQKDRIYLEMVLSKLYVPYDGILMLYSDSHKEQQILQTQNIADFLDRLKADLDLWLKDFFNEFLLDQSPEAPKESFLQYDKERIIILNRYVDKALKFLKNRLKTLGANRVKLPGFLIHAFNGMVLELKDGSLSGLDTMYRRSMATNSVEKDVRKVDALIAFSSLKAWYSYEVKLTTGEPPLFGSLILSGDELSAIMSISMVKEPVFVDLKFDFIQQLKPQSLTVEGSVGRIISTFKHILELHIIAIMTNTMIAQVKYLSTLTKCVPTLLSYANEEIQDRMYFKGIDKTESTEDTKNPKNMNCDSDCRDPCGPGSPFYPCTWPTRPREPRGPIHRMTTREMVKTTTKTRPTTTKTWRATTNTWPTTRKTWPATTKTRPTTRKTWPATTKTWPTTRITWPATTKTWPTTTITFPTTTPTTTTTTPTTTITTPTTTTTMPTTTTTTPTTTTTTPTTTIERTTSKTTRCRWWDDCCYCNNR